jgi:predicted transcriptional regulator of viral defense system
MAWGAPPAIDIIDAIMRHTKIDYYVGWLSAASLLGASHHAPQVFQVATSKKIRNRTIGRSKFQFYHREHVECLPIITNTTNSGSVKISSVETTMLDIANNVIIVGGIDNLANLIIELCESNTLNSTLLAIISKYYPTSTIRRLGYLIEHFVGTNLSDELIKISDDRQTSNSILDPHSTNIGIVNNRWKLKVNREVEPDV